MRNRKWVLLLIGIVLLCLMTVGAYYLPPVHSRLAWRIENFRVSLLRRLKPPEEQVFVPQSQAEPGQVDAVSLVTSTTQPTQTPTLLLPTVTLLPSPTATLTPTPPPQQVALTGILHEYQQFNNCGPATLAMALTYWGWRGDQRDTRLVLRPNFSEVDDKNVNPWEMVKFVEEQAGLKAVSRVGGELSLLKRLVAAGFPTIIELGIQPHPGDWMGHYLLVSGYDDEKQQFTTQDSLVGADLPVKYDVISEGWRSFNHVFVTISSPERQAELQAILGEWYDESASYAAAARQAEQETGQLVGRDQFFSWFNLGSNLAALDNYPAAAQAYDQAFAVYATIPEEDRPWRMMWYQQGPYTAYYYTGRYQDVITLGNQALDSAAGPLLEESFYWLGLAREATGDMEKAVYDYQKAVEINPASTPALKELQRLGIESP